MSAVRQANANSGVGSPDGAARKRREMLRLALDRGVPLFATVCGALGVLFGLIFLATLELAEIPVPLVGLVSLSILYLAFYAENRTGAWDTRMVGVFGTGALATLGLAFAPTYFTGLGMHVAFHRSIVASVVLLSLGTVALSTGIYYLFGATPRAGDLARYPGLVLPIALAFTGYALIIGKMLYDGVPHFQLEILLRPYIYQASTRTVLSDDGWPTFVSEQIIQQGMRNQILGTGLLVLFTAMISLPVGVGTGVYLTHYAEPGLARIVTFCTTALRAISLLILGLTAFSLYQASRGTFLQPILAGYWTDTNGFHHPASGSYITAAIVMSMLVIPIISRSTEEGCRSRPRDMYEGSLALGASEGFTLTHVTLPWAYPNILTGLLLGCAEAAGSVAVILFIAGTGTEGIGPFNQVTTLSYLIFGSQYGASGTFRAAEKPFQFTAGILLLLITMGLTAAGLYLKQRLTQRNRGGTRG